MPTIDLVMNQAVADRAQAFAAVLKQAGHSVVLPIRGNSMGRALPNGARITIQSDETGVLQAGQVIACLRGRTLIVHRIVYCGRGPASDWLLTRGDARLMCDAPFHRSAVLGPVTHYERDGRRLVVGAPVRRNLFAAAGIVLSTRLIIVLMHVHMPLAGAVTRAVHVLVWWLGAGKDWLRGRGRRV